MSDDFDVDSATRGRITAEAIRKGRHLRMRRRLVGGSVAVLVIVAGASAAAAGLNRGGERLALVTPPAGTSTIAAPTSVVPSIALPSTTAPSATTTPFPAGFPPTTAPVRTTLPVRPPGDTTTVPVATTLGGLPPCGSRLVRTASTAQKTYSAGTPIVITEVFRNTAAACSDTKAATGGCVEGAFSAYDSAGALVWQSAASATNEPDVSSCPAALIGEAVAAGWSESFTFTWHQTQCDFDADASPGAFGQPNPDCPNTQVPVGTYSLVGAASTPVGSVSVSIS
jgi:hypothetical protein